LTGYATTEANGRPQATITIQVDGTEHTSTRAGTDPVEALTAALSAHGIVIEVLGVHETRVGTGSDTHVLALVEYRTAAGPGWAAGQGRSPLAATQAAVMRAANASPLAAALS
jgi:2-isopropylmalate synthase